MIDIYTEKKDSKDWIIQNDLFFNLHTGNEEMSEKDKKMIKQIDGAILTSDKHIETQYGLGRRMWTKRFENYFCHGQYKDLYVKTYTC